MPQYNTVTYNNNTYHFPSIPMVGGYNSFLYNASLYNALVSLTIYTPQDLDFYRTNVDGQYVFHWGFAQDAITPFLPALSYELQLDTSPTFSAPLDYNPSTAFSYQNGNVRKGFVITVNPRINKVTQTWYARVRSTYLTNVSPWSETLTWTIIQKYQQQAAEDLVTNLPDFHVYGKEDLLLPVNQRNTNLYVVMNMYGQEFDQVQLENFLTSTNNYLNLCRDEQIFQNFGVFFNFNRPQVQVAVEYRESLRALVTASLEGSTVDAINRVIRSFTGVDPTLELVRNFEDFFLSTMFESPPQTPNGVRTFFSTVDPDNPSIPFDYVSGSLVVLKNGIVLTSGVDFTEVHSPVPGFNMTVAPSGGSILQDEFDTGVLGDPQPVVFDGTDSTLLTGVITFTHGSTLVTGVGTHFTSQLLVDDEITDSAGIYLGVVTIIINDTSLIISQPWGGNTEVTAGYVLAYPDTFLTPPVLWDMRSLAYALVIQVNNPGEFVLDEQLIENLTKPLLPSFVLVYFTFN